MRSLATPFSSMPLIRFAKNTALHIFTVVISTFSIASAMDLRPPMCPNATTHVDMIFNRTYTLKSPGFDSGSYPANMTCSYVYRVSNSTNRIQIKLKFLEMEEPLNTKCEDYLTIHDGSSENSPEIESFCARRHLVPEVETSTGMAFIRIVSDDVVQRRGVHLELREIAFPGCDSEGWQTSQNLSTCFALMSGMGTWVDSQRKCYLSKSNLMTFTNREEYEFITNDFNFKGTNITSYWVGIHDSSTEGTLQSILAKEPMWPPPHPVMQGNSVKKDCMLLDTSVNEGQGFFAEDCNRRNRFICKKLKNGQTINIPSPRQFVRRGRTGQAIDMTVWILIIVASILLFVIGCIFFRDFIKRRCCKERDTRVGVQENRMYRDVNPTYSQPTRQTNPNQNRARFAPDVVGGSPTPASSSSQAPKPLVPLLEPPTEPSNVQVNAVVHRSEDAHEDDIALHQVNRREEEVEPTTSTPVHMRGPPIDEEEEEQPRASFINRMGETIKESTFISRDESFARSRKPEELFERPKTKVLDNVSAISLDEFWHPSKTKKTEKKD